MKLSTYDRMMRRVTVTDGCWLWTGAVAGGYGRFYWQGALHQVHRVMYELVFGAVPDGLYVHHECNQPLCVRPDHLRAVTQAENIRLDPPNRDRARCKHGHEFDKLQVVKKNRHGNRSQRRVCSTCQAAASRRYRQRKVA